jgi:hypothetical protein
MLSLHEMAVLSAVRYEDIRKRTRAHLTWKAVSYLPQDRRFDQRIAGVDLDSMLARGLITKSPNGEYGITAAGLVEMRATAEAMKFLSNGVY